MADEFDPWSTSSGFITDYTGTVFDAFFQLNDRSSNYELVLKMTTDNDEEPEVEEKFGCGADWFSTDSGDTVEHKKPNQRFNMNSGYGKLIDRAAQLVGPDIREWGSTTKAATWIGTQWHWAEVVNEFTRKGETEKTRFVKNFPDVFVGRGEPSESPSSRPKVDEALMEQIKTLAQESSSYEDWVNKVFSLPGVTDNDKLVKEIADESGLYTNLRNAI